MENSCLLQVEKPTEIRLGLAPANAFSEKTHKSTCASQILKSVHLRGASQLGLSSSGKHTLLGTWGACFVRGHTIGVGIVTSVAGFPSTSPLQVHLPFFIFHSSLYYLFLEVEKANRAVLRHHGEETR